MMEKGFIGFNIQAPILWMRAVSEYVQASGRVEVCEISI